MNGPNLSAFKQRAVQSRLHGGVLTAASLAALYSSLTQINLSPAEIRMLEISTVDFFTKPHEHIVAELHRVLGRAEALNGGGLGKLLGISEEDVADLFAYAGIQEEAVLTTKELIKLITC